MIFINDLPDYCLNSCMFSFANDSKCRAINFCDLQLDGNRLFEWARKNGMTFIIDKNVFSHFANHHVLPNPYYLAFDESVISDKCEVIELGLKVSNKLKWKLHLNWKIKNWCGMFFSIKRTIPFSTPMHVKVRLIKSNVYSSLFYCSPVWLPNQTELKSLNTLLSRVTKCVTTRDFEERLTKCKMMTIKNYLQFLDLTFMNSLLSEKLVFPIWNYVLLHNIDRQLCSSQKPSFEVIKTRRN